VKLPFLDFFKRQSPRDYFLALLFRDEEIRAVVFEQIAGRIQVIGEGLANLPESVETISDEALLNSADQAISVAEKNLPNGVVTHKTVFGVKETWVTDSHITKDYLTRLKGISQQLELTPIGFLVFPEAIAHLLQKEEGAPVSAILIDAGQKKIALTLIRAGRIVETKEITKEEELTTTVESGLKEFENIEIFPSRLILFDKGDKTLEKKFLLHHWSKSLPFLHVPQVTTLAHDFDTRAILFGTATQMGLSAIDLVKQPLPEAKTIEEVNEIEKGEFKIEKEIKQSDEGKHENKNEERSIKFNEIESEKVDESFGFVKNADISEEKGIIKSNFSKKEASNYSENLLEEEKEEEIPTGTAFGFSTLGPIFFEGAKRVFANVLKYRQMVNLPGNKIALLLGPLIVVFLILGFIFYFFALHAKVNLILSANKISQDASVTFVQGGSTDISKSIVGGSSVEVTEDGNTTGTATGTKDIGDKAKGSITIFNSDSDSHTLDSGIIITCTSNCSGNLQFTLDSSVTIASGSSDPTNLSAGTATVNVTAVNIGTEYNVPSGAKFSIPNSSVLAAKNSNAFSGGTKKSVTVVAQKDIDSTLTQLTNNLKDKAKSDILGKVGQDQEVLPEFISTTITKKSSDKNIGDEANSFNQTATISFAGFAYKKSDIENLAKSAFAGKLPAGENFTTEGFTFSIADMTNKNNATTAHLNLKASLAPNVNTKDLAKEIAGKSFSDARSILSKIPQFSDATFMLSPNLFFLPKGLPNFSGNINIIVSNNE